MPKYVYTLIVVTGLLWLNTILWLVFKAPDTLWVVLLVMFFIFLTLAFTLSWPLYFVFKKKVHYAGLEKSLLHRSLRLSTFTSFGVTGVLVLKIFDLFTLLNFGIFILLLVAIAPFALNKH